MVSERCKKRSLMFLCCLLLLELLLGMPQEIFANNIKTITDKELAEVKRKPCVLIHVWATWCQLCLQETPKLIQWLYTEKRVHPVLLDISSPFVQENFSKKWIASLKPGFTTFVKPNITGKRLLASIDPTWDGALPYSALYHGGKKRQVWVGMHSTAEIHVAVDSLCH